MSEHDSAAIRALKAAGYKITGPRQTILEILEQGNGHMTAAELLTAVEARDPSIGRASVFRTLDLMVKIGLLWPSVQGGSTVHYMLMPNGHHHHIICTRCEKRIEFEDCRLGELIAALEAQYGIQIEGHLLELYGVCADCKKS
jgi:Fur family ferric uptake transcriptional regulator